MEEPGFPDVFFLREDESADTRFYAQPRFVTHIDDFAIAAVTEAYRRFLKPGGDYLDLMSSWVSHFPLAMAVKQLVGLGMNELELARNPRLTSYLVHDLNLDPMLPFGSNAFDGVTICVSVQYLTQPLAVFTEIARVLRPGAPVIVSYSNRCFPTKAVRVWQMLGDEGHGQLVSQYVEETGAFEPAEVHDFSPATTMLGVPDDPIVRRGIANGAIETDPLFVIIARKRS